MSDKPKLTDIIRSLTGILKDSAVSDIIEQIETLERKMAESNETVEELEAICTNVAELLSTMEPAHLQTAWHILNNAGFTKNEKLKAQEGKSEL